MTSTPPDEKLGRESMCKPDAGDISATEGKQTRESGFDGLLYELEHPAGIVTHNTMRLHKEAATAIRSLTEEVDALYSKMVEAQKAAAENLHLFDDAKARAAALTEERDKLLQLVRDNQIWIDSVDQQNAALTARAGELEAALRNIAEQHTVDEIEREHGEGAADDADYPGAYDTIIGVARAAIANEQTQIETTK